MKKHILIPALSVAGGAAALVLRLVQVRTGFEADTGLAPAIPQAWRWPRC